MLNAESAGKIKPGDGWTSRPRRLPSAQWEHTLAVTANGKALTARDEDLSSRLPFIRHFIARYWVFRFFESCFSAIPWIFKFMNIDAIHLINLQNS